MTRFIPDGRGAHAELVVVHGDSAAAVPDGLGLVEAATVPMNGLTVRLALRHARARARRRRRGQRRGRRGRRLRDARSPSPTGCA